MGAGPIECGKVMEIFKHQKFGSTTQRPVGMDAASPEPPGSRQLKVGAHKGQDGLANSQRAQPLQAVRTLKCQSKDLLAIIKVLKVVAPCGKKNEK